MTTPRRLTPEESSNAFHEGKRQSDERRQQTAKMRLSPTSEHARVAEIQSLTSEVGLLERLLEAAERQNEELKLRLAASEAVALAALEKAKKLEAAQAAADVELAEVRHNLAEVVDKVITANERAKVAEAEIAQWRKAVVWHNTHEDVHELRVLIPDKYSIALGSVWSHIKGWEAAPERQHRYATLPDRDAACKKVCEMLALPEILPADPDKT